MDADPHIPTTDHQKLRVTSARNAGREEAAPARTSVLSGTIFHESWWMEIASEGSWSQVTAYSGGLLVGRLPFQISKGRFGMTILDMPPLVHVLGPIVAPQFSVGNCPGVLKGMSIVDQLIAQLPRAAHVSFRLHGGMTHTLGFEAAGFTNKAGFTVEIKPDTQTVLWRQMRDKTRNVIRRAEERLDVDTEASPEVFLDFYQDNLHRVKRKNFYSRSVCSRLLEECLRRGVGRILLARDKRGEAQSAIFTVWDHETEFYFLSTRRPDSVNGAASLLVWKALQHASENGLKFDMDGLHIVNDSCPNLLLLTGFGGIITPRYQVHRSSLTVQLASSLRESYVQGLTRIRRKPRHFTG